MKAFEKFTKLLLTSFIFSLSFSVAAEEISYEFDDPNFDTGWVNPFASVQIIYEDLNLKQLSRFNELALEKWTYAHLLTDDEIAQLDVLAQARINAIRDNVPVLVGSTPMYDTIEDFLTELEEGNYSNPQNIEISFDDGIVEFFAQADVLTFGTFDFADQGMGLGIRSVYELAAMAIAAEDNELNIRVVNPGEVDPSTNLATLQIEFLCPNSSGLSIDAISFTQDDGEELPVVIVRDVEFVDDQVDEQGYRNCDFIASFPVLEAVSGVLSFSVIDAFGIIYSYVSDFTYGVIIGNTGDVGDGETSSPSTDVGEANILNSGPKNGLLGCTMKSSNLSSSLAFFVLMLLSVVCLLRKNHFYRTP